MKTNHQILQELDKLEQQVGLYEVEIEGIPIWRLIRFNTRKRKLFIETGFINKTEESNVNKFELVRFFMISLFQLTKLFLFKSNYKNAVFAFPRLFFINDSYIDKFTDPVISNSDLKKNTLIFQHSFGNAHAMPRKTSVDVIYTDFIDVAVKLFSIFLYKKNLKKYKNEINSLSLRISKVYDNDFISKKEIALALTSFKMYVFFYNPFFRKFKFKNIFLVSREVFKFVLYLGKKNKAKVFEFQHGITQTETPMYTGPYLSNFDPDFFLTFGEAWKNAFFGIPQEKIFNIGWAYKDYVKNIKVEIENSKSDTFLVISSPSITQNIIDFVSKACEFNTNLKFDIRLHPQERLSNKQLDFINHNKNIDVICNKEESIFSIKKYNIIIGDNSSVLYEAISLGKKVGKINFEGIFTRNIDDDLKNGFFIINNFSDLERSLSFETQMSNEHYYSTFNQNLFNKLIL